MQVDWLKKNLRKYLDRDTRISILQNLSKTKEVPVSMGAKLLDVNHTTVYYTPVGISNEELECKTIIDWYSRCIVGWELDDTLCTGAVIRAMERALMVATPEIVNSDQGTQFTSDEYMQFLKNHRIRQSMDGKSRWADNIMIERWFRSLKYEEIYLNQYDSPKELRAAIHDYVYTYNFERCHSAIDNQTPASVYFPIMLYEVAKQAA